MSSVPCFRTNTPDKLFPDKSDDKSLIKGYSAVNKQKTRSAQILSIKHRDWNNNFRVSDYEPTSTDSFVMSFWLLFTFCNNHLENHVNVTPKEILIRECARCCTYQTMFLTKGVSALLWPIIPPTLSCSLIPHILQLSMVVQVTYVVKIG